MTNKYFQVTIAPDCIMGDISDLFTSDDGVDLSANDLIADWTEVDIPRGANLLKNITMVINNPDAGAVNLASDFVLLFAKSVNGVAPASIKGSGFGHAPVPQGIIREHLISSYKIEGTTADTNAVIPVVNDVLGYNIICAGEGSPSPNLSTCNSGGLPIVIELDPISGTNVGFDKLYVAVLNAAGTHSFETNVLANYSSGAPSADSTTTIIVDTVDPRKLFSIGDTIYNGTTDGTTDTAIGVIKSIPDANTIELEANNAVAIANNDEIINGNPIRITLGFER